MLALRDYIDEGPVGKRRLPKLSAVDCEPVVSSDDDDEEEEDIVVKIEPTGSGVIDFEPFDA